MALLAAVYRRPLETFDPLIPAISKRLESIGLEANALSVVARRDVLSVRMSVVAPELESSYGRYNPDLASSVWPGMGASAGDEVVGLYHLGLKKQTEQGHTEYPLKPQVATEALLREMTKLRDI